MVLGGLGFILFLDQMMLSIMIVIISIIMIMIMMMLMIRYWGAIWEQESITI